MKTSQAGIDLIKKFESVKLIAYRLPGEKYYTIGYGHNGPDVTQGMKISQAQAEMYLSLDLTKFENYVTRKGPKELSQLQFDALVSYTYNRGYNGLRELVAACKDLSEYPANIVKYWGSVQRYKTGLVRRRKAEAELFTKGMKKDINTIALEVIGGKWGTGAARKQRLKEAGYDPSEIQNAVNFLLKK